MHARLGDWNTTQDCTLPALPAEWNKIKMKQYMWSLGIKSTDDDDHDRWFFCSSLSKTHTKHACLCVVQEKCFYLKNITRRCIQVPCVEHFTIVGEWHCIVHKLNAYGFVVRPLAVWSANAQGISVAYAQRINVGHWTNRWFWRYVLWLNVFFGCHSMHGRKL